MPGSGTKPDNEQQMALRLHQGDRAALRAVYDAYARYLTAVCTRYIAYDDDVKDVLQEAFIRIYDAAGSFEYRGSGSFKGWLTRIVVNQALKHLRDSKTVFVPLSPQQENLADEDPDTEQVPAAVIHKMIRELPDGYRAVFNLYVLEQRSHKEIAALLGISESTSASQLHRAKALLASKINKYRTAQNSVS